MRKFLAVLAMFLATGEIDQLPPYLLTVYDPRLMGINCNETCYDLADGHIWQDSDYLITAACPKWMVYRGPKRLFVSINGMRLACRDTGPNVRLQWNDFYNTYVLHIDVLYPIAEKGYPDWNYSLHDFDSVAVTWRNLK